MVADIVLTAAIKSQDTTAVSIYLYDHECSSTLTSAFKVRMRQQDATNVTSVL